MPTKSQKGAGVRIVVVKLGALFGELVGLEVIGVVNLSIYSVSDPNSFRFPFSFEIRSQSIGFGGLHVRHEEKNRRSGVFAVFGESNQCRGSGPELVRKREAGRNCSFQRQHDNSRK